MTYNAPFFTTWFCTNWTVLFFPLYFFCQLGSPNYQTPTDILGESVRNFRDRGFTAAHFLTRCCLFCMLWVFTNYLYIHALSILVATDALALFAINVCCVYLLSWVILHDQFVGVRVSVPIHVRREVLLALVVYGIHKICQYGLVVGHNVVSSRFVSGFLTIFLIIARIENTDSFD